MDEKSRILKKANDDQSRPISFSESFGGSENQLRFLLKNLPDMRDDDVVYTVDDIIKKSDKNNNRFGKIVHEQQDIMHRNYKLMQLNNVDISGGAKLKINRIVNGKIQELVKSVFQKQFIEDRMYGALPDLDSWLRLSWTKLNRFAKINNNGP